jgi:hypothetical protein
VKNNKYSENREVISKYLEDAWPCMCCINQTYCRLAWWYMSIIPAMQEMEIRRIIIQGQPKQKGSEAPIAANKFDMAEHI